MDWDACLPSNVSGEIQMWQLLKVWVLDKYKTRVKYQSSARRLKSVCVTCSAIILHFENLLPGYFALCERVFCHVFLRSSLTKGGNMPHFKASFP